jgi:hypothetical protein
MNMQMNISGIDNNFNLNLGRTLFSDPQRDKQNAVVVSNHQDIVAGIEVNDLVKVDFTVNQIDRDGLYVITLDDGWIGYRRFQFMPKLRVVDSHDSYSVTPEILAKIKVVGLVKDIYRSVK